MWSAVASTDWWRANQNTWNSSAGHIHPAQLRVFEMLVLKSGPQNNNAWWGVRRTSKKSEVTKGRRVSTSNWNSYTQILVCSARSSPIKHLSRQLPGKMKPQKHMASGNSGLPRAPRRYVVSGAEGKERQAHGPPQHCMGGREGKPLAGRRLRWMVSPQPLAETPTRRSSADSRKKTFLQVGITWL